MRKRATGQMFPIILVFQNSITRTVKVRASSREVAERRALKRNPHALGVKPNA